MAKPPLILVVDDETHVVHVLSVKLQRAGFRVVFAMDGREGLACAIDDPPDLVITDYQMPFLNGLELCAALQDNDRTQYIPVILLTARSHHIKGDATPPTNIKAMIGKPFSPREVLSRVCELLGMSPGTEVARAS